MPAETPGSNTGGKKSSVRMWYCGLWNRTVFVSAIYRLHLQRRPWTWKQHVPSESWYPQTCTVSQVTEFWRLITTKTWKHIN